MKYLLWILAIFFSSFIVTAAGYGLIMFGGIGLLVFLPIIGFFDFIILRKLGLL